MQHSQDTSSRASPSFQRLLGNSELSYFLPSRADGVNDMYLHLGFHAPSSVVNSRRLALAWSILRIRHPLLASRVIIPCGDYESIAFQYFPPHSPSHALEDASHAMETSDKAKDALIDSYLNGPRTLSNDRLSYLILSCRVANTTGLPTPPHTPLGDKDTNVVEIDFSCEFDLLICAAHFIGDGMALHTFANDLLSLLAGQHNKSEKPLDDVELLELLTQEWTVHWGECAQLPNSVHALPPALENRLPEPRSTFQRVAQDLEFDAFQNRLLGSHAFPRRESSSKRHTIVPTTCFNEEETRAILTRCKKEGISISHLIFAVCNNAWIKIGKPDPRIPMMMYSALNLRPHFPLLSDAYSSKLCDSYWFLAVGYFNVVLPSFPSSSVFNRARETGRQCIMAIKNQHLLSRTRCMAHQRSVNAKRFADMDDREKLQGMAMLSSKADSGKLAPLTPCSGSAPNSPPHTMQENIKPNPKITSSKALLGLSLLGNLDGIYKHGHYPSLTLHTLTTGSRQRRGGLLVFGYTFVGKLWLSLGYDQEAYDDKVGMWWDEVVQEIRDVSG